MATKSELLVPIEQLQRCLSYRDDGELVWTEKYSSLSPITLGAVAGTALRGGKKKYRSLHFMGQKILLHRAIWAVANGKWPDGNIDHVDGDEENNRLENLREVTASQNSMNRKNRSDNASGLKGARLRRNRDGSPVWVSCIWIDGKSRHLGRFSSPEAAHAAYVEAAKQNFGQFARAS